MKTAEELTEHFRAEGLRVTPQRQAIFRLLHKNTSHPTVEALYEAARDEMPTISLKTVYQTVHDLAEMGEVDLLDVGTGSFRVDPNVEHAHHHLVCTTCGEVRDINLDVSPLTVPARLRRDFAVDSLEVIVRGSCSHCAGSGRA